MIHIENIHLYRNDKKILNDLGMYKKDSIGRF